MPADPLPPADIRCHQGRCGEVDYGINCPHCRHRTVTVIFDGSGRPLRNVCADCGDTITSAAGHAG